MSATARALCLVWFTAVVLFPACSGFAYPVTPFHVGYLLRKADVVCKLRVLSVSQDGPYVDKHFQPPLRTKKQIARVQTVSRIKGSPAASFEIAYPTSTNTVRYESLAKDEIVIVFLAEQASEYQFVDPHQGKLPALRRVIAREYGETPSDRLLAELIALARSKKGAVKLVAVEQLGKLGDVRARDILRRFSRSGDPVLSGVSLAAMIEMGEAPSVEAVVSSLKRDPAVFGDAKSLAKYRTTGYRLIALQQRIIYALQESIEMDRDNRDMVRSRPLKQLEGFDYKACFTDALKTKAVRGSDRMRREIAHALRKLADRDTVPLLRQLVKDSSSDVRYYAVTALTRVFGEGPFPALPTFKADEARYISYWEKRLGDSKSAAPRGTGPRTP
jgi:HEAT repeat protein